MRMASKPGFSIVLLVLLTTGVLPIVANAQDSPASTMPPAGMEPLPVDLLTTENFYFDQEYWTETTRVKY